MSLVVSVVASQTMLHTDNPDQRSLPTMHQVRTQGLGFVIAKEEPMELDREPPIKAIEIQPKTLKKIQHDMAPLFLFGA